MMSQINNDRKFLTGNINRNITTHQYVIKGKWCRLDNFRKGVTQITLTGPAGSFIRIRYGWKWFCAYSPVQQLDGMKCKSLTVVSNLHYIASAEILASQECFVKFTKT